MTCYQESFVSLIPSLTKLRKKLHRHPELSGTETETAQLIHDYFHDLKPDAIITGLGGHGVAIVYDGREPGRTLLLRCELDALPIQEANQFNHRSAVQGVSHKCGHDGHMAILAGVGHILSKKRPDTGRVVLLYQPAEETGAGAAAVLSDPRFKLVIPDMAFALHNLPGYPIGEIVLRSGPVTSASAGITFRFTGKRAHAAEPEAAVNPARALADLIAGLTALTGVNIPNSHCHISIVHAELGEPGFGTTPEHAALSATLRAETEGGMERMHDDAIDLANKLARRENLNLDITRSDVFPAGVNSDDAVDMIKKAATDCGLKIRELDRAFRWSEDFGRFTSVCPCGFFGLGAGEQTPALHSRDYDFPDAILSDACCILEAIINQLTERQT